MDKPIQFITIDKDGVCGINQEAEKFISNINEKVAVICVAGLYRTGKSYLLNRLLGRQDGFEIGPTTNSCTKGLWIWGQPIKLEGRDFSILLIDTEGLGSAFEDRNETIDMEIFCLGFLLSSLFIYNSMKNIDENAIESLAMVINFAKKIQEGFTDIEGYVNNYPSFLWVLRDFALDLVDHEGRTISSSQYLENALMVDEGVENTSDENIKKKNEIRKLLKIFFKERDCSTLIRPVSDEKKLRHIDKIPVSEIRAEFLSQAELFVKKVFLNVRPKLVQGSYIDGKTFINLAKMYVDSINSNSIPDVKSSWKIVVDTQLAKVLDKIYNYYIDEMLQIDLNKISSIEELFKLHNETKSSAFDYLNEFANINVPSSVFLDSIKKLEEKLNEKFNDIMSRWKEFSEKKCRKITEEILKEYKINNQENDVYTSLELIEDVFKFVDESVDNSRKYDLIYPKVIEFFVENLKKGFRENKSKYDNEVKLIKHETTILQGKIDKTKEKLENEREENQTQIQKLKEELLNMRLTSEAKLDEKTKLLKTLQSNHEDNMEDFKTKIYTLNSIIENQKQNEKVKKKATKNKEDGLLDLKIENILEKLDGFKDVFIKTELDRAKMQLQIEMNSRIEEVETEFMKKLSLTKRLCEKTVLKLKNTYQDQINNLKQLIKELYDEINDFKCQVSSQEYKIELYKEKIITYEKEKKNQTDHAELLRVLTGKLNSLIDNIGKK